MILQSFRVLIFPFSLQLSRISKKKKKARKINNFQEKYLLQTNCSSRCEFSLIINVAYWIIGGLIYEKRLRETKLKNLSIGTEKKR